MYINKKHLNKIAKAKLPPVTNITTGDIQWGPPLDSTPKIPERCQALFDELNGMPLIRRAWFAIEKLSLGIGEFAEDLYEYCNNPGGDSKELGDSWHTKVICAVLYLDRVLDLTPGATIANSIQWITKGVVRHFKMTGDSEHLVKDKKAFCKSTRFNVEQLADLDMEDWLKEFGVHMQITPQPVPTNIGICPDAVVEGIIGSLSQIWEDELAAIKVALVILVGAIVAAGVVLAAMYLAGVPAVIATAVYAAAVATARLACLAALALIGFSADEAQAVTDGAIDGLDSCEDPSGIEAEEPIKGEGCCVNGLVDYNIGNSEACSGIGGNWGDLQQLGCLTVPDGEK